MKKHLGFTLIELMVVMAIIAILATAGLTAYSNYLKKARDSARAQIARELMTKVEELAGGGTLPGWNQLLTFLAAENFAPVDGNGRLKIDPLDGAASCLGSTGNFDSVCVFTYTKVSDGTYYISYPVEHPDNVTSAWYINNFEWLNSNGTTTIAGKIIGTNPYLIDANLTISNIDTDILSYPSFYPSPATNSAQGVLTSY